MSAIPDLYHSLPPTPVLHPALKDGLRVRMQDILVLLIRKNIQTTFFRESDLLAGLRGSIPSSPREGQNIGNDGQFLTQFAACVPLSTYDAYRPFVNRFFPSSNNPDSFSPCRVSTVKDLLSPGLPIILAQTSASSSSEFKFFPKYPHPMFQASGNLRSRDDDLAMCRVGGLRTCGRVAVVDIEEAKEMKAIPITIMSSAFVRVAHGITLENEEEMAHEKLPLSVSPIAVGLLPSYKAVCFYHLFFAVADNNLGYLITTFTTILSDSLDILMEHWDLVVNSIEKGILPEAFELGGYKSCLQMHVKPNPTRAQELRPIAVGKQGWLKKVWPHLKVVRATASGTQFSAPVPKLRHQFGPDVTHISGLLASTECTMGAAYSASDLNLFKLCPFEFFEFLATEKQEISEHLSPCWEVETGKQYEVVATTQDGLWRYRMGDIVEIAGFAPEDGMPLMRFVERRGVKIRIAAEILTETQLAEAIHSENVENILGHVVEFTTVLDDRKLTKAYGFFVEVRTNGGDAATPAPTAIAALQAYLSTTNVGYGKGTDEGRIGRPTIRIVAPGTFQAYREWKVDQSSIPVGQVKVPVAISPEDQAASKFFEERTLHEV